jgi:hypothetical protein
VENGATGAAVGNILLVPYYTVQNGNSTLINIVNTDTVNGKAVKVRFRGGKDSDDIFDFQLFMSPGDVWTANVSQNANGLAYLTTTDKTCSLPAASVLNATPFITARLPTGDVGGTLEGYVEIFNMADIPAATAGIGPWTKTYSTMSDTEKAATLYGTIKHSAGVAACNTTILTSIEAKGAAAVAAAAGSLDGKGWYAAAGYPVNAVGVTDQSEIDAAAELVRPTGGLMGNWTIINVPNTTVYSGEAVAIAATTQTRVVYSRQTDDAVAAQVAQSDFPNIRSTYDAVLLSAGFATAEYDFPDLSTPYEAATANAAAQALALSASIAHNSLINEFLLDTAVSAQTDWLVSMPTRRYLVSGRGVAGVDNTVATGSYKTTVTLADNSSDANGALAAGLATALNDLAYTPDTDVVADAKSGAQAYFAGVTTYASNGRSSCVNIGNYTQTDREETTATTNNVVVSPSTVSTVSLCGEVNVLSLNNLSTNTGALGAKLAVSPLSIPYASGWAAVNLNATGHTVGLPSVGYSFVKAVNPAVSAGISGTFGGASAHRW